MKRSKFLIILLLIFTIVFCLFIAACAKSPNGDAQAPGMSGGMQEPGMSGDNNIADTDQTGGTLTQEAAVDEGDIVKMYDDVIYKLQSDGITVYRVNAGSFSLIGYYEFTSERQIPLEMYVTEDKIVALYGVSNKISGSNRSYLNNFKDQSYSRTIVCVLQNPTAIEDTQGAVNLQNHVLYDFEISAQNIASRHYIESGQVYFAFTYMASFEYTEDDIITTKKATIRFKENGQEQALECANKIDGIEKSINNMVTVFMRINIAESIDNCTIGGLFGASLQDIYMSETSIIPIFNHFYEERITAGGGCSSYTYYKGYYDAYCLKLNPITLDVVDGVCLKNYTIYDRRAIKDFGDTIYITATKRDGSGTTVIALSGNTFSLLNKLESIAPNENVKSVAYEEVDNKRYCYITTFRQTDPLFKVEITDPYALKSLGYLKITGYSTFMLPVGDRLLTIGYADDGASEFYPSRMRVAIYNTEGDSVLPLDELIIDDVIYCEALTDPRVIAVSGNVFAFACVTKDNNEYYQGLYIFQVANDTLEFAGMLTNLGDSQNYGWVEKYSVPKPDGSGDAIFGLNAEYSFAFSITRARYYDGYIYTMSDAIMTSHKVTVTKDGVIDVSLEPTEKIYTSLSTDYEEFFNALIYIQ